MTRDVDDRFEQLHTEVVRLQVWNFRYSVVIGPERRERSRGLRTVPPHALLRFETECMFGLDKARVFGKLAVRPEALITRRPPRIWLSRTREHTTTGTGCRLVYRVILVSLVYRVIFQVISRSLYSA